MKIRVRFGSATKVIPIEDEVANYVQLSELRRLIQEAFGDCLTGSFSLSLNKTDIFKDETQTLKDCEIVSGDLLHIISDCSFAEPNQKKTKPLDPPQMNVSDNIKDTTTSEDHGNTRISTEVSEPEVGTSKAACSSESFSLPQHFKGDKISLQVLLSASTPTNVHQTLIVALHYLMLDSGFYLCDGSKVPDVNTYTACCDVKNQLNKFTDVLKATEFYKLYYFHPFCEGAMCLMTCIPMATKLVINGKVVAPKVASSSLPKAIFCSQTYVNEENSVSSAAAYRKLPKLTRIFKDTFALCMLGELKHALGFPDYTGLLGLHSEIMLNIMSDLDVKSLSKLSQVCRNLWILSQDNLLWRTLCQRDFKGRDTADASNDWKKEYKKLYESKKRTETLRDPLHSMYFQMPQPFCFPPPPPQQSPFSTVGGDYDIHPEYFNSGSRFFQDPFI